MWTDFLKTEANCWAGLLRHVYLVTRWFKGSFVKSFFSNVAGKEVGPATVLASGNIFLPGHHRSISPKLLGAISREMIQSKFIIRLSESLGSESLFVRPILATDNSRTPAAVNELPLASIVLK